MITSSQGKKIGLSITIILVLALGAGSVFVLKKNDAGAVSIRRQPARPVKTMKVSGSTIREIRTFPGVVQASREVDLAFRVGGPLVELHVRIGQRLPKGDVIARIDSRDYMLNRNRLSAALNEARARFRAMKMGARPEDITSLEARLKVAQARMKDAETNYRRQKQLLDQKAAARVAYDRALLTLDTARAELRVTQLELKKARSGARLEDIQAAQAGIQRLEADLKAADNAVKDTILVAPFSGYVGRKLVDNYENVVPGKTIVTLLDSSSVEIRSNVPEDIIIRQEEIAGVGCTLDAYPGRIFPAIIKELGRKTEKGNQNYPLTVSLKTGKNVTARPGMAATLMLKMNKTGTADSVFLVPYSAVFVDPHGETCVWRVDMESKRVVRTPVTTGSVLRDKVRIISGLTPGDQVVVAGARFLRDNQEIRILNWKEGHAG